MYVLLISNCCSPPAGTAAALTLLCARLWQPVWPEGASVYEPVCLLFSSLCSTCVLLCLQGFINKSFENIASTEHALNLLRQFQSILQRESLKASRSLRHLPLQQC